MSVEAAHRACRERVREVRSAGDRAAEVRHPAHPVARRGEEVLRRGEGEVEAREHRRHEQPDEPHVVVQRQPRHADVLVARARRPRRSRRCSAARQRCGSITPLGSAVDPLVNWRIPSASGSSGGRSHRAASPRSSSRQHDRAGRRARRRGRARGRGRRATSARVGVLDAPRASARVNSSIEPSRIGNGRHTSVPPASHVAWIAVTSGRDVGPRMRDVVAGPDAARLERGGHGAGVVVEAAHWTRSRPSAPAEPRNVRPVGASAAASRRGDDRSHRGVRPYPDGTRYRASQR